MIDAAKITLEGNLKQYISYSICMIQKRIDFDVHLNIIKIVSNDLKFHNSDCKNKRFLGINKALMIKLYKLI